MRRLFRFAVLCAGLTTSILAQGFDKVLLPIVIRGELPGSNESNWISILSGYNASAERVIVRTDPTGCAILCPPGPADPFSSFTVGLFPAIDGRGMFLHVENSKSNLVFFNLRIQDISRQSLTWGTEFR